MTYISYSNCIAMIMQKYSMINNKSSGVAIYTNIKYYIVKDKPGIMQLVLST